MDADVTFQYHVHRKNLGYAAAAFTAVEFESKKDIVPKPGSLSNVKLNSNVRFRAEIDKHPLKALVYAANHNTIAF